MEISRQNPKPKPIRGVCFPQIFLLESKNRHLRDLTPFAILKYFPKHIDSLPHNLSHSNLKTRIKHLKIIKRIPDHYSDNTVRTLFANKRKNVKFAAGVGNQLSNSGYDKHSLQLLKMFPNIQKVEFCVQQDVENEDQYEWQAKQHRWIDKMSRYLRKMTNLKYLYLSTCIDYLVPLLSKVNSFETMLSGLDGFQLHLEDLYWSQKPQAHLKFPKVLKHLTHLRLHFLSDEKAFQFLLNYCSQLLFLSLQIEYWI